MTKELVVLVDKDDNPIGTEEKLRAHELGLLHRAFSIFLFNDNNEILLQQRADSKYHCGGLWTNTCCSHPRLDEPVILAGKRRMQEELGFSCDLQEIGSFTYRAKFSNNLVEHEYDHVLVGRYNGDPIKPHPDEVQDYKWVSIDKLEFDLKHDPEKYTPWFSLALQVVHEHWQQVA